MLEEDKYYTPETNDFCEGFEYECKLNNGNWSKMVFIPSDINFAHSYKAESFFTLEGNTRAKYLDGDDIMSFNCEIANDEANTYRCKKKKLGLGTGDDKTLYIYHEVFQAFKGDIRINTHIWWRENRGAEITVFEGSIKNKSEFRKILKQIHADTVATEQ